MCFKGEVHRYAEQYGFVGVCPQGLKYSNGETGWNAGTCCSLADEQKTDDTGFIRSVIEYVSARVDIPAGRTFAGGFSNGCGFAYRLACELSDVVHGVGCAGMPFNHRFSGAGVLDCKPSHPRPIWTQAGTKDKYFRPWEARKGWSDYAKQVLGCHGRQEEVYNDKSVRCYERTGCPSAERRNRYCELEGFKHGYQMEREEPYRFSPTEAAWLYLSQGGQTARMAEGNASTNPESLTLFP